MPSSANCPKNPSNVRADVGIRAPILLLSQQPLSRCAARDASEFRSDRLGLRSEMEPFHFQRRRQGSATALGFRAADPLGRAYHLDVSRREQLQNALVESKVAN